MSKFIKYKKKGVTEMRPVTKEEIELGRLITTKTHDRKAISVSDVDLQNGSPKSGDMIARNPNNHDDQWLVAKQYFLNNYESIINTDDSEICERCDVPMERMQKNRYVCPICEASLTYFDI